VVNNVINDVVNEALNEVNLGELRAGTMESRIEKLCKQYVEEIREYKARIFELENQVATLTMGEVGSSSSTPINLQSLEAERDTTLQETKIAKSQALEVCIMNEVMQGEIEALQKEVVDMQQQLQVVNEVVVDHEAKIGRLEEQNARLKQFLSDAIVKCKYMRTETLLAMAKARQFEAEFESIKKEWNRNHRMRNMMLTSWPEDEQMYPSRWDENNDLTLPNGSIDWWQMTDEDHHWDVTQVHE
jgi:chromosome segregation ATPase